MISRAPPYAVNGRLPITQSISTWTLYAKWESSVVWLPGSRVQTCYAATSTDDHFTSYSFIPILSSQTIDSQQRLLFDILPKWQLLILPQSIIFMTQVTQTIINDCPEIQVLQGKFKQLSLEMEQHAKEGKYVLAENCRVNAEKLKKELDCKRVVEVEKRQKKENKDVKKYLKEELTTFEKEWEEKISSFVQESAKIVAALKGKHKNEWEQIKSKLQEEIPEKWKESSQCLNLRKIEENLAKQQSYVQAQKVQKLVREMEKKEQEAWLKARVQKIDAALDQLKIKQEVELKALEKRIESGKCELEMERTKTEGKLVLKHSNVHRDIQSQNKKEFLSTKGEFKSRIDVLSPSKSRLLSPNTRSKLLLSMTR